jgi:hypothetical protein
MTDATETADPTDSFRQVAIDRSTSRDLGGTTSKRYR